ncbi:DUF885 domain-containing protein [soil metagenome]
MQREDGEVGLVNFETWMDRFFDSYYRHRPVNATFIGVHDYDDRLPDFSDEAVAEVTGEMTSLLENLDAVDRGGLSEAQEMDLQLGAGFLEIQLWEYGSRHFQRGNPSLYVSEAVFGPMSLFLREATPLEARLDAAAARFDQVPRLLEQARTNIRTAPRLWIEKAIDECAGGINFASDGVSGYLQTHAVEHPKLVDAAGRAAAAFEDYRAFLRSQMLPTARDEGYGCGVDALDLCIRKGHFLSMTPAEILDRGWATLEDSRIRLESWADYLGKSSWQEALLRLADDHPPAERYLDAYGETWVAARNWATDYGLVTWPDYPIRFIERPQWARSAAPHLYFLYYRAPPAFDPVDVVDYLVEPLPEGDPDPVLRAHNSSVIKLNHVVHHGGLGHHVQNWHAYRAESRIGRVAAVDCASRIAMLCGGTMAEGWSCYATDLMEEFGFCTPLESMSQVQGRLRMAVRAIADVGLHSGAMSIDQVIALYRDEAGMSETAARAEATKNSMNPGAALMYLLGTDQIHELRTNLFDGGSRLKLWDFHDAFLSYGSVPVSLISESMRQKFTGGA